MNKIIDLFKSDITVIPESTLDLGSTVKEYTEGKLGKPYITIEDIRKKQEEIFNYNFKI